MGKKLIIAEKPSMSRDIQAALESAGERFTNKGEYTESENYICTSVIGHIFGLQDRKDYPGQPASWNEAVLPFIPSPKYEYVVQPGKEKRAEAIEMLLKDSRVEELIHAGDADREGQIIGDIIIRKFGYKGPVTRLWAHDLEKETILKAIRERKSNNDPLYKGFSNEGFTRQLADWAYGINLTTYATVKAGEKLNVGRVVCAIIMLICERDREIKNFVSQPYWQLSLPITDDISIESKVKHMVRTDAEQQCSDYNSAETFVKNVDKKEVVKTPPKLFSQTTLQNACSDMFGFSPDKTLQLTQTLYERKLTTYPRTDSEYLSTAEKDKVKRIIAAHGKDEPHFRYHEKKSIFDDSKVDAHSAITITTQKAEFTEKESDLEKCYSLIYNRFLMNFYDEDYIVDKTEIKIEVATAVKVYEQINLSGEVMKQPGWSVLMKAKKDRILPVLEPGMLISSKWGIGEKETTPPKHYQVKSLNNTLMQPFKNVTDEEDDESADEDYKKMLRGISIGTDATRAGIIQKAINEGYISLKKKTYYIEPKGEYLCDTLQELKIDMSKEKTVHLNQIITAVRFGEENINSALQKIYDEIDWIIKQDITPTKAEYAAIGKCPLCGKMVKENAKAYSCSDRECKFVIWKTMAGKKITAANAKKILKDGESNLIKGFKSKSGKTFDAKLKLNAESDGVEFKFDKIEEGALGKCPLCKKNINAGPKAYYCSNSECDFVIWKTISGKEIKPEDVKKIVETGKSDKIKGFKKKKGGTFSAALRLTEDRLGVEFDF